MWTCEHRTSSMVSSSSLINGSLRKRPLSDRRKLSTETVSSRFTWMVPNGEIRDGGRMLSQNCLLQLRKHLEWEGRRSQYAHGTTGIHTQVFTNLCVHNLMVNDYRCRACILPLRTLGNERTSGSRTAAQTRQIPAEEDAHCVFI